MLEWYRLAWRFGVQFRSGKIFTLAFESFVSFFNLALGFCCLNASTLFNIFCYGSLELSYIFSVYWFRFSIIRIKPVWFVDSFLIIETMISLFFTQFLIICLQKFKARFLTSFLMFLTVSYCWTRFFILTLINNS